MVHAEFLKMARTPTNNMIFRAELVETKDGDGQQVVKLRGRDGEELGGPDGDIPVVQQYGMSTHVPKGAHALVFVPNGNMSQAVVLGWEHPDYRPKNLNADENKIYHSNGDHIIFTANGIKIVSGSKVVIEAPDIALKGNVYLGGDVGSGVPASKQGTIDTGGFADTANLATKVKVV